MTDDIIIRDFTVNLAIVGMAAINATGRYQYVIESVAEAMPQATDEFGQIHFCKAGMILEIRQPAIEAAKRGLALADPHTLAAFNAANSEFAETHPNATEWIDERGNAYYALFNGWNDERVVGVDQSDGYWCDSWWFAGVRKSTSE